MDRLEEVIKYSKKLKLLYVEDNIEARESTAIIFDEFFGEIVIAVNGEDGYEKFSLSDFDLIITDINMPKLNGLEMIKRIRKKDLDIPILVLSAYNESGFFIDSIKLGVEGYLLKPIDMEQFVGVLDKITSRLKLSKEAKKNAHMLEQYKQITDKSAIVLITDADKKITFVNDAFCTISQYKKDELIGINYHSILKYKQPKEISQEIYKITEIKKEIWTGVLKFVSRCGRSYYLKTVIKPILDEIGEIIEFITLRNDVTEIMNPKKQLDDAIKNSKEPAVIYLKLEDFSTLEELYDNETIEMIQDKIKTYLEENIPKVCKFDKVYQLGNGEYALVIEKSICTIDIDSFKKQLKEYQEKIKRDVIDVGDINYDMSVIISLAYDENHVLESAKIGIKELLKTKHDFIISNNFALLKKKKAQRNMETILMIKKAINDNRIVSYFQPIVNNKTEKTEKYESLVRLTNEDGKILSPFLFLDVAKKGRYYSQITNIVLEKSFEALNIVDTDISINLSALDIEKKSTRNHIFNLLSENKENASRVVFELLEDESVKDFQTIQFFIDEIKKFGVKIAIDDFGAGYSNFERLLDYQPDILKIDGCLIKDITTNNYSLSVVKTIVAFAKEQNIQTIAEFVENEEIYNVLKEIGVDFSQGYYFGKPGLL